MTDLPSKDKFNARYLMVITDWLLKSVTLEAITSMNAEDCAERFMQCHFRFLGFPIALTSDRGSNWVGDFWTRLCQLAGIEQRLSTAYYPETDGATEKMNQEVLTYLRAFISTVTRLSSFFLEHGYHIEPIQLKPPPTEKARTNPAKRAERFMNRIREAQEYAAAAMAASQQIMEEQAN
ncbi:hypothetical protein K3495_g4913 [Podosphaera aphanis]|nr:hypothetical protein K3495_g4913 [Podosphaera aphanis]